MPRWIALLPLLLWPLAALAEPLPADVVADRVLVEKAARRLTIFAGERTLKTYPIALGRNPVGPKRQLGDKRTPEGHYTIDRHVTQTNFHLALHISYPNDQDRARARRMGVSPGGNILIHGLPKGWWFLEHRHLKYNWTDGCVAVTDAEIEELWRAVPDGTPIEIRP